MLKRIALTVLIGILPVLLWNCSMEEKEPTVQPYDAEVDNNLAKLGYSQQTMEQDLDSLSKWMAALLNNEETRDSIYAYYSDTSHFSLDDEDIPLDSLLSTCFFIPDSVSRVLIAKILSKCSAYAGDTILFTLFSAGTDPWSGDTAPVFWAPVVDESLADSAYGYNSTGTRLTIFDDWGPPEGEILSLQAKYLLVYYDLPDPSGLLSPSFGRVYVQIDSMLLIDDHEKGLSGKPEMYVKVVDRDHLFHKITKGAIRKLVKKENIRYATFQEVWNFFMDTDSVYVMEADWPGADDRVANFLYQTHMAAFPKGSAQWLPPIGHGADAHCFIWWTELGIDGP